MARRRVVTWFDVEEASETSRLFDWAADEAREGRVNRYYPAQLVTVVVVVVALIILAVVL